MAKFISHVLTGVSGSVGDTTYSHNRNGNFIRKKIAPTQPRTNAVLQVRAAFTTNAQAYRLLSDTQRAGWASLGAQMSTTDSLGQTSTLTGAQAYSSINGVLASAGGAALPDAPGQPDAVAPLPTITLSATRTAGVFGLQIQSTGYAGKVQIYATPAVSAGRNYFGKSSFRLLQTADSLSGSGTGITAVYAARFGAPAAGTKIAVKLVPVSANGFKGASYFATAIVPA